MALMRSAILFSLFVILFAAISACNAAQAETTTREMHLWVGPEMVDCTTGTPPGDCYQVKYNANDAGWSQWSKSGMEIKGFQWEAGYKYELLLKVTESRPKNSDFTYVSHELIKVVSKTRVE